jgi:hypothetical protein
MSASLLWSLAVRGEDNDSGSSSSSMKMYKDMKIMHNISRIPKKEAAAAAATDEGRRTNADAHDEQKEKFNAV